MEMTLSVTYDEEFGPFFGRHYRECFAREQQRLAAEATRVAVIDKRKQHPGVYMLVCGRTKHAYIGSTSNLHRRERTWRCPSSVTNRKMLLYLAGNTDWHRTVEFVVLREFPVGTDKETLFKCERYCIEQALAKGVKLLNVELPRPQGGGEPF